jgi:hypothetical protein
MTESVLVSTGTKGIENLNDKLGNFKALAAFRAKRRLPVHSCALYNMQYVFHSTSLKVKHCNF